MAKFEVKNSEGKKVAEAELAAEVYGIEPNIHVMHHIVKCQQACWRQRHGAARTLEQLRPHLLLQQTDLLAQRGLAHMQTLGRTAEIQLLGHSQKTGQAAQIHRTIFVSSPDANGIGRNSRRFSQSAKPHKP